MPAAAPLQVLVFRHPDDPDVARFEEAVVRAFQGGKEMFAASASFHAAPPLEAMPRW